MTGSLQELLPIYCTVSLNLAYHHSHDREMLAILSSTKNINILTNLVFIHFDIQFAQGKVKISNKTIPCWHKESTLGKLLSSRYHQHSIQNPSSHTYTPWPWTQGGILKSCPLVILTDRFDRIWIYFFQFFSLSALSDLLSKNLLQAP